MFHHYIATFADKLDRRKLKSLTKARKRVDQPIEYDDFEPLLLAYKNKFFMHLLQTLPGNTSLKQRYYLSFLFEFKGVSRSGLDVMNAFGIGNALTTYDRYRRVDVEAADKRIRYSSRRKRND